jgi:hypothetical protein
MKTYQRKAIEWSLWAFWLVMLLGHLPLLGRCLYRMFTGVGAVAEATSLVTLVVSCAFFVYKLAGMRLRPVRPSWRKIVVYVLLGTLCHVAFFCPSMGEERIVLLAEVAVTGGFALYVACFLASVARKIRVRFLLQTLLEDSERVFQRYVEVPTLRPARVVLSVYPHRGPPCAV